MITWAGPSAPRADAAVAVGDLVDSTSPERDRYSCLAVPLRKFGPFVLGDHPWIWTAPSLGIVEGWGVSETDRHVEAGEFLEDEDWYA